MKLSTGYIATKCSVRLIENEYIIDRLVALKTLSVGLFVPQTKMNFSWDCLQLRRSLEGCDYTII